ncbi:putative short chain oxidoreductase/dehydrogenase [Saccharata proteae CBS 121410]|uniref:Short chain oxidoreductase/dehydrogenase n=1 Tax=Saccharata proteae CBS 121410 TaxID=1314787 RepID=A0A9P4M2B8_9PEZI|nr:putative short chain oxidoreductase/dehydrogenase [Saccharata proteae CBS 121410]
MEPLIWFITGATSGIGLELAVFVLKAGHPVIGTVRDRTRSADAVYQIEALGGKCVTLDVTQLESIPMVIEEVIENYGRIDVLVNNAGYPLMGTLEDVSSKEIQAQMNTNFFGPVKLMQAVIPSMRERKSGTILNVSSAVGLHALPSASVYSASKFALEGVSEGLSRELASFNVNVIIMVPGSFQTNIQAGMIVSAKPLTEAYKGTMVEQTIDRLQWLQNNSLGDPARAAKVMFEAATGTGEAGALRGKVERICLGSDALKRMAGKIESLQNDYEAGKQVAASTDSPERKSSI